MWLSKLSVKRVSNRAKVRRSSSGHSLISAAMPRLRSCRFSSNTRRPSSVATSRVARPSAGSATRSTSPSCTRCGDLPAHRRRVGVHGLGERACPAGPVLGQVHEQQIGCAVDGVGMLGLVLGLDALEQTHEADELAADLVGGLQLLGRGHVSSEDPLA